MEYLIAIMLSLAVAGLAAIVGFDRERAYYPTVMIVIAAYYILFAAMAASGRTLVIEIIATCVFLLAALVVQPATERIDERHGLSLMNMHIQGG